MATIVEFRPKSGRREQRRANGENTGEVVLFPGIRYERWSDHGGQPRAGRRVRDTLDLVD